MLCKTCAKAGDTECGFGKHKACPRCRRLKVKCESVDIPSSAAARSNVDALMARRDPAQPANESEAGPSISNKRRSDEAISIDDLRYARKTISSINNVLQEWVTRSSGGAACFFPLEAVDHIGSYLDKIYACMEQVREKNWTMREGHAKYEELEQTMQNMMNSDILAQSATRPHHRGVAPRDNEDRPSYMPEEEQRTANSAPQNSSKRQRTDNEQNNQLESEESSEEESQEDDSDDELAPDIIPQVKEEEDDCAPRPSTSTSTSAAILRSLEHAKKRVRVG